MPFVLPALPYHRESLTPFMSPETLDYHHGKHHQAYVDKTNELAADAGADDKKLVELIASAAPGPLFNNAAQVWNHSFFWQCLSPDTQTPSPELATRIDAAFGSLDAFKAEFAKQAVAHFGSGWAWLVMKGETLEIVTLHDADTPVAHAGMAPLLTVDVWEHAYYLDHRNARPKYVESVLDTLVNWDFVARNLDGNGALRADQ